MVSGTKTKSYFPGGEFQYNFTANRTFSRQGGRRGSTPKSVKIQSRPSTRGSQLSPEDVIALAQSPESDLIRQSFGSSLLLLQSGRRKVKPGQFVDLRRLSQEPTSPALSLRGDLPTPRLAQHLVKHVSAKEMSKQASTQTMFGDATATKYSSSKIEIPRTWESIKSSTKSQDSYPIHNADRCVRCSDFPDIQIEGRSLSRILTNPNTVMAREYCEILGPESCPDCARTRSQRSHQRRCIETSPSVATDVYKLALVHERAPYLSMREVQRKVYDGDISDNVGARLRSTTAPTALESKTDIEQPDKDPEISVTINKRRSRELKSSKSFAKPGTASTFETIPEATETSSESDLDDEIRAIPFSPDTSTDEDLPRVEYRKLDLEKPHKVRLFPANEKNKSNDEVKKIEKNFSTTQMTPVKIQTKPRYDKRVADLHVGVVNLPVLQTNSQNKGTLTSLHTFTKDTVPSRDFFFDIADLADRLRRTEITERSIRRRQRETEEQFLKALAEEAAPQPNTPQSDLATDSASVDSIDHVKTFNMSYEPPVLYENKGRYLGVKAPPAGHRASASR